MISKGCQDDDPDRTYDIFRPHCSAGSPGLDRSRPAAADTQYLSKVDQVRAEMPAASRTDLPGAAQKQFAQALKDYSGG